MRASDNQHDGEKKFKLIKIPWLAKCAILAVLLSLVRIMYYWSRYIVERYHSADLVYRYLNLGVPLDYIDFIPMKLMGIVRTLGISTGWELHFDIWFSIKRSLIYMVFAIPYYLMIVVSIRLIYNKFVKQREEK